METKSDGGRSTFSTSIPERAVQNSGVPSHICPLIMVNFGFVPNFHFYRSALIFVPLLSLILLLLFIDKFYAAFKILYCHFSFSTKKSEQEEM